jgi:hypothetical protein
MPDESLPDAEWTADKVVKFIEDFENDRAPIYSVEEYNTGFQILIDSGLAFQLGRQYSDEASRLIDDKQCTPPRRIFCIGCID